MREENTYPAIPLSLLRAIERIPVLRFLKEPVNTVNELHVRYPDGGEHGWFAFVYSNATFAYWSIDSKRWEFVSLGMLQNLLDIDVASLEEGSILRWSAEKQKYISGEIGDLSYSKEEVDGLIEEVSATLNALREAIQQDYNSLSESVQGNYDSLSNAIQQSNNALSESINQAYDSLNNTIDELDGKLNALSTSVSSSVSDLSSRISAIESEGVGTFIQGQVDLGNNYRGGFMYYPASGQVLFFSPTGSLMCMEGIEADLSDLEVIAEKIKYGIIDNSEGDISTFPYAPGFIVDGILGISGYNLHNKTVPGSKLIDKAVASEKLADKAVTPEKLTRAAWPMYYIPTLDMIVAQAAIDNIARATIEGSGVPCILVMPYNSTSMSIVVGIPNKFPSGTIIVVPNYASPAQGGTLTLVDNQGGSSVPVHGGEMAIITVIDISGTRNILVAHIINNQVAP